MSTPLFPEDHPEPLESNQTEPDTFGEHTTNAIAYQYRHYQQNRINILTNYQGTERKEKLRLLGFLTFGIDHPTFS
jgi:hypothetical protein